MIRKLTTLIMSFSPRVLLNSVSRERCVNNMRQLPPFLQYDAKPKRFAAVLVPLCVVNDEVCILYTLRSSNLKNHKGQVAFPGGMMDDNETIFETALRETEEEIGILREDVDVWGIMSQVQGRNNEIAITPIVGEIKFFDMMKVLRNPAEVDEVFTVPISELVDPANHAHVMYKPLPIPVYLTSKHKIWGITGHITHFFLQSLLTEDLYKFHFNRKKYTIDELIPSPKL